MRGPQLVAREGGRSGARERVGQLRENAKWVGPG
jgi:hypothetical protein